MPWLRIGTLTFRYCFKSIFVGTSTSVGTYMRSRKSSVSGKAFSLCPPADRRGCAWPAGVFFGILVREGFVALVFAMSASAAREIVPTWTTPQRFIRGGQRYALKV